ncbi:CesT family type III secretion system chaperone [Endozoicomonas sp. Mp262]|uniref:CesT family type III secretion system chaperone n=1 Tax=Endozoicomonas sp. Mp262 TaxID=2919499 RepID=UPI0021DACC26
MSFDTVMKSFASQNDMDELDFRDNTYFLTLDDAIEAACFQANGNCYIHGILASLPEGNSAREQLLVDLLKTSLALIYSHRVSLCLEPDGKQLALYLIRPLREFDEIELENALIEFINAYEVLKQVIDQQQRFTASGPMMLMP